MGYEELKIEGRNAVLEAFRSGKTIDKLFVLDGCQDGPVRTIVREAKKHDTIVHFVEKERLDQLSETKKHQGVIAVAAAYEYAEVEDMLKLAEEKGEPPFLFILDNIEDPHNLALSSVRQILPVRMVSLFRNAARRSDGNCGKDIRRSNQLYTGCKGDKSDCNNERVKGQRNVVCLCGHGWNLHV